ncbi:MAG TPA: hypothetical protein VE641_01070, partial [Chthoniobacterales bacterium]|nr:hypothetical protein [Chthoniobacterales bacterium]
DRVVQHINEVFLLSDKRQVTAFFERNKLRSWKGLTSSQRILSPEYAPSSQHGGIDPAQPGCYSRTEFRH